MFKNLAGSAVFNSEGLIVGTYPVINLDYNESTGKFSININSITNSSLFTNNYNFEEVVSDDGSIEDGSIFSNVDVDDIYKYIKFIEPRKAIMYTGMLGDEASLYEITFDKDNSIVINKLEDESLYTDFKTDENLIDQCY